MGKVCMMSHLETWRGSKVAVIYLRRDVCGKISFTHPYNFVPQGSAAPT